MKHPYALVLIAVFALSACASAKVAPPTAPATMHEPFSVDGFTVTFKSLQRIEDVTTSVTPIPGTEMWVVDIAIENHTGGEQGVGGGFRLQSDAGVIVDSNFVSVVSPQLDATLANGGHARGYATFSLPSGSMPVAVLARPGTSTMSVPVDPAAVR